MRTFLLLILLAVSCSNDNGSGPVDITYGEDICERCKMIISEERYSSQLILENGKFLNFDDIGGMIIYVSENNISPQISKIYVKDFNTMDWLDSENAVFVEAKKIKTPMGFGIIAFSDMDKANQFILDDGGRIIGSYSDIESSK